jgi:AcrR family transcriptional regulator
MDVIHTVAYHTITYRWQSTISGNLNSSRNAIEKDMAAPTRTPRGGWIDEGLRALAAGGPDAVRIEALAKALDVTKGGFYWHFDDRRALLEEMLDRWERVGVDEVIERVEGEGGDARAKLRRLSAIAGSSEERLRIDLAVRDWARREKAVAKRLRRVDNRRMDYMRSLFGAFCVDEDEIEVRCIVFYSLWIGSNFIAADHGPRSRADVLKLALRRLEA